MMYITVSICDKLILFNVKENPYTDKYLIKLRLSKNQVNMLLHLLNGDTEKVADLKLKYPHSYLRLKKNGLVKGFKLTRKGKLVASCLKEILQLYESYKRIPIRSRKL